MNKNNNNNKTKISDLEILLTKIVYVLVATLTIVMLGEGFLFWEGLNISWQYSNSIALIVRLAYCLFALPFLVFFLNKYLSNLLKIAKEKDSHNNLDNFL